MTAPSSLPTSDYFRLEEAGDGVWAAIATEYLNAQGNTAIVDLGGRTLIVDAFGSARVAHELRAAARALTGTDATWLVNTHFHADHTGGNEVFAAVATIASTEKTRLFVSKSHVVAAQRIAGLEAGLAAIPAGDDPGLVARRAEMGIQLDYLQRLHFVAPDATVTDRLTVYGDKRRAELIAIGVAHTKGDLVVNLPDDRIVATGDAVLVRSHVYAGDGSIPAWPDAIQIVRDLAPNVVIPGHGDVGGPADIEAMAAYIAELIAIARASGGSPADAAPADAAPAIPERFRTWGWAEGWPGAVKAAIAQCASEG